jgi:hypothetical protein
MRAIWTSIKKNWSPVQQNLLALVSHANKTLNWGKHFSLKRTFGVLLFSPFKAINVSFHGHHSGWISKWSNVILLWQICCKVSHFFAKVVKPFGGT